jgi:hypothetical protein
MHRQESGGGARHQMLAAWAGSGQLTPSREETIRRAILKRARHTGYEWRPLSPRSALGVTALPPGLVIVYRTLAQVVPGWPTPTLKQRIGYRPYLRVV